MLSIHTSSTRLCDGVSRREWLRVGGLSSVGLMLPDLLAANAVAREAGTFGRARSCIVCFLFGGPAHQDVWDLKPYAPDEVRGPFQPIATSVPGTQFGEHIPQVARLAHRFALIRSMTHADSTHTVAMHYLLTGQRHRRPNTNPTNLPDDFPCYGAVVNRFRPSDTPLPSGISVNAPGNEIPSGHIFPGFFAGFLGRNFDPLFVTDNPAQANFDPLPVAAGLSRERIAGRTELLSELDRLREPLRANESLAASSRFQERAMQLVSSPAARRAFDLSRESPSRRERYGASPFGQGCLLARRLVEAGVRLVTVNWARDYQAGPNDLWDTHRDNFNQHRQRLLPPFDTAYSALLEDLDQRGLLAETLVVVLGEFGRTPKINPAAGRDHWPGCFSVTLAGAGIRGGLVHGASDRIAGYPTESPVGPEDLAATIYHALGIPLRTEVLDHSGRPQPIATGKPLLNLF